MAIDLDALGLDLDDLSATSSEQEEEAEDEEEEAAEETTTKTEETEVEKDNIDRSVPLLDRIKTEFEQLKLETGFMKSYELASASYLCELVQEQLSVSATAEAFAKKWDENLWSFPDLWKAVQDQAYKESDGKSFGCSDRIVMGWVAHFVYDDKPDRFKPKPKLKSVQIPTTPKNVETKPKKKEKPKPEHGFEQIDLLEGLI